MTNDIAKNIASQIGNRAFVMLGAKNLIDTGKGLQFKIGRNAKGVTHIGITLDQSDTYTVTFTKVGRNYSIKTLAECSDVYADSLHTVIESNTGLYTSL